MLHSNYSCLSIVPSGNSLSGSGALEWPWPLLTTPYPHDESIQNTSTYETTGTHTHTERRPFNGS